MDGRSRYTGISGSDWVDFCVQGIEDRDFRLQRLYMYNSLINTGKAADLQHQINSEMEKPPLQHYFPNEMLNVVMDLGYQGLSMKDRLFENVENENVFSGRR